MKYMKTHINTRIVLPILFLLSQVPAHAEPNTFRGESLGAAFQWALNIIMAAGFIWGVIVVVQGFSSISRGDEGWLKVLGGVLMAGAATVMYFAFANLAGTADPFDGL